MSSEEATLLLVMSLGAYFIPFAATRMNLPSAVGEILFGLFLSAVLIDVGEQLKIVHFLAELGFIILMFLAGLEIDTDRIRATPNRELGLYVGMYGIMALLSLGIIFVFDQPMIYVLVYLTTAIGLLFPVLKDASLMKSDIGQKLLILGSIGEIVSLVGLTAFAVATQHGMSVAGLRQIVGIGLFAVSAWILLRLVNLFLWWYPHRIGAFLTTGDTQETGIRASFVLMFIFVAFAGFLDIELIIGAFIGGLIYAVLFRERETIAEKMGGIGYGFLIPVFFIEVGLRFSPSEFFDPAVIIGGVLISVMVLVVRILAAGILAFARMPVREIVLAPFALAFPLTLMVALSALGLNTGAIERPQAAQILFAAVLTALVYPWGFKLLAKRLYVEVPD